MAHILILYLTPLNSLQMLQNCHLLKMNVMVHPDHHRQGNQKLYSAILYKHLCTISIPLLKRWAKSLICYRDQPAASMCVEICCNYLEGKCLDATKCLRFHDPNKWTYCWEYKQLTQDGWTPFTKSQMTMIEQCYCDPSKLSCHISING